MTHITKGTSYTPGHLSSRSEALRDFFEGAKTQARAARDHFLHHWQSNPLRHPLLNAFQKTGYGRLRLTLPNRRVLNFGKGNPGPEVEWRVYDWSVFDILLARGEMGAAETYINNLWDTPDLPAFLNYCLKNAKALEEFFYGQFWFTFWATLKNLFRKNTLRRARRNVLDHYDLGNDFYALWLDESMTYSCALFDGKNRTLEEAQAAKYQRILEKLALAPGAHVLDIGCGWGGFAEMAGQQSLHVVGATISDSQRDYAVGRMRHRHLDDHVKIRLCDYRLIGGEYDGIVSIGMFEHVGMRYWPQYFSTVRKLLKPAGKAVIQCIILDDKVFRRVRGKFGFIEQVIFPGGVLPSREAFIEAAQKQGLRCVGTFQFGKDYALTLRQWLANFEFHKNDVRRMGYDEFFIHLWRFYLAACIASFESNRSSVMQAELVLA